MIRLALLAIGLCTTTALTSAQSNRDDRLSKEILRELVWIRSTERFPENTVRLLKGVTARFRAEGFTEREITFLRTGEVTNLVVRYPGTGERTPILLMAHVDVVEADAADWETDPFTFAEIDSHYYGRGTQDNKTGAAALITNFIRFKREGYEPERDLILMLTGNEETSMEGARRISEEHSGLIDAELALNSDSGGVQIDDDGKPVSASVQMSEKLFQTYDLEVTNPGGHSSLPRPDNAIYQLAEALLRIRSYRFPIRINAVVRTSFAGRAETATGDLREWLLEATSDSPDPEALRKLASRPGLNASMRTTCVATMLRAGVAENALPRSAVATVNCRILPGETPEEVLATLREVVDDDEIEIRPREGGTPPSSPSPIREDVMTILSQAAREFWGEIPFRPRQSSGATDGLWVRRAGIPVYAFGGAVFGQNRRHGLNERIGVEAFHTSVRYWYEVVKAIASQPGKAAERR